MALERKEHVEVVNEGNYARQQRVTQVAPDTRNVLLARIRRLLWLLVSIITGLITIRFILKLIGANAANTFVNFMYGLTDIFVGPFNGIVQAPTFGTNSIIDIASIFAIVVYVLATWALVALIRTLFAGAKKTRTVSTYERQS